MNDNAKQHILPVFIIILLILSIFSSFYNFPIQHVTADTPPWWNSNWNFSKTITIDSSKVDTPLVNFSILVPIPDATADKCDGGDSIRFLLPDNSTELPYEIEDWTDGNDRIVWVNVSRVESGSDSVILMYYNNSGASDGQDVTGTWDSNYVMVQHMNDSTTSTITDSTSYNNDGTKTTSNNPVEISSKIAKGQDFDGSDSIDCGGDASVNFTGSFTAEVWFKLDTITQHQGIVGRGNQISSVADWYVAVLEANTIYCNLYAIGGASIVDVASTNTVTTGTWYYMYISWDGTSLLLYVNTEKWANDTGAGAIRATQNTVIGDENIVYEPYGIIDEVRLSNIARNASWLNASFHTQNQTTDFITWGAEVTEINNVPTLSGEVPANASTGISLTPVCNVTANDADGGDTLNISFYENTTGSWILQQTNSSVNPGTSVKWDNYNNASAYNTKYWWAVNSSDGTDYVNETYHFTTMTEFWSNTAPTLTNEIPTNQSTGISLYPQLNVTVTDADGNNSNVYWYTNASGNWYLLQTNTTILNTSAYLLNFTNASAYSTKYWWRASANDTHDNTTETYHFTTATAAATITGINSMPRVTPCGISDIGNTTANATMNITKGYNCSYGVWYGTTFPVTEDNADGNISGIGIHNQTSGTLTTTLTGLTPSQLYYTTVWASNPSGMYNSSHYTYSFANYSYIVNGSGWQYITFPSSIWDNNQSVNDSKDVNDNITVETFLQIGGILDDVDLIFRSSDFKKWEKGVGGTLTNLTFDEEYNISFLNATNISFLFDMGATYIYRITFPQELFDYNSSLNANNTCENFLLQGGIWDDISLIFYWDAGWTSWSKARYYAELPQTLTHLTSNNKYRFYSSNHTTNLNFIYDKANTNSTFLTRPNPPTNLNCDFNAIQANLSWDKNLSANKTVLTVKLGSFPSNPNDGTLLYNGTGEYYVDSYDDYTSRFYRVWSYLNWTYNPTLWHFSSDYDEANTTYTIDPPYNGLSTYDYPDLNLTWDRGNRSIREVVVSRNDTWATSADQSGNWIRQNSTNTWFNESETQIRYYTIWSYNLTDNIYSIFGLNIEYGGMAVSVFNESNPTQAVTDWDIEISNQEGTESYAAYNQNNILYLDLNDLPMGVNTIIQIDADGYKQRTYYTDTTTNQYFTLVAYLPPVETPGGDESEGTLRTFTDTITVTNPAVDATITLTHELEEIISVEIYNSSLYGTYGGWIAVPNDNFTYNSVHVVVNSSVLDVNTTMARASYYYMHYEGMIRAILCKIIVIDEMDQRISNATCIVRRINNATGDHINISIEVTDGYGEFNIWLLEETLYSFHITKSGFTQEGSRFWIPSTLIYTKTFKLSLELPVIPDYDVFWNIVTFKATVNANNTIHIVYCDSGESTINTTITVFNVTNITRALLDTDSRSGEDCFSYYIHGIDANETHVAVLHFNNTATFDVSSPVTLTVLPIFHGSTPFDLDERVKKIVGPAWFSGVDVGWHNIFAVILPIILLISFGVYNTGLGIFSCGLGFGLVQGIYAMWFTNTFNAGLVLLCPVIIVIAIIYMWTKGQGGDKL